VFFNSEAFARLEEIRDNKVCSLVSHFQSLSRGFLSRARIAQQKVSDAFYI